MKNLQGNIIALMHELKDKGCDSKILELAQQRKEKIGKPRFYGLIRALPSCMQGPRLLRQNGLERKTLNEIIKKQDPVQSNDDKSEPQPPTPK